MLTKVMNKTFKGDVDKEYKDSTGVETYYGQRVHLMTARKIADDYLDWLLDNNKEEKVKSRLKNVLGPMKKADKEVTLVTVVSYLLCEYNIFKTQEILDKWFKKYKSNQRSLF